MSAATITVRSAIGRLQPPKRSLSPRLIACATPRARSRIALSGLRLEGGSVFVICFLEITHTLAWSTLTPR